MIEPGFFLENFNKNITSYLADNKENFSEFCEFFYKKLKKKQINNLFILGNGGSSSIASHCAVDFTKVLGVKAQNFSDHNLITCFANDYKYVNWTKKALEKFANDGDIIILISSSGESKNMINAAKFLKKKKVDLITFTGFKIRNPLSKFGKINFWINSNSYNEVEMCHHILIVAAIDFLKVKINIAS